jgi:hypothetical protein
MNKASIGPIRAADEGAYKELTIQWPRVFGGVQSAYFVVFAIVMAGTYVGVSALAYDYDLSICWLTPYDPFLGRSGASYVGDSAQDGWVGDRSRSCYLT